MCDQAAIGPRPDPQHASPTELCILQTSIKPQTVASSCTQRMTGGLMKCVAVLIFWQMKTHRSVSKCQKQQLKEERGREKTEATKVKEPRTSLQTVLMWISLCGEEKKKNATQRVVQRFSDRSRWTLKLLKSSHRQKDGKKDIKWNKWHMRQLERGTKRERDKEEESRWWREEEEEENEEK